MDNERHNERTWWSSRLEEPGALPGTGLADKEAAWDKLYDRLKGSNAPRRKRIVWLWTAAACLLLIVVPVALLLKDGIHSPHSGTLPIPVAARSNKENATSKDRLASRPAVAVNPRHKGATHPHPALPENSALTRPAPGQSPHPTSGQPSHPMLARPDLDKLLAHGADTLTLVFAPRPDLSKPIKVTATTPIKKEQRVVHINELEPSQPTPAMVKGPRQKPGGLRIGLDPQETFRPSNTYAGLEAHSILSLKHTQNP